ncbi:hypothetical protein GQ55_4G205400 [Panicum hallii var. hallii]|uniref:Uncharacterized protein n=1 Tax=Panicum hallii var. hallii TaxID=1504633 RepID=A0A2T7DZ69_9POAL|nr:hypothetical protein GQ55_4G205400 [Panicum hallii var. hallii]
MAIPHPTTRATSRILSPYWCQIDLSGEANAEMDQIGKPICWVLMVFTVLPS